MLLLESQQSGGPRTAGALPNPPHTWDGNHQDIYVHFDLQRSLTRTTDCFALEPHLQLTKVRVDGTERQL